MWLKKKKGDNHICFFFLSLCLSFFILFYFIFCEGLEALRLKYFLYEALYSTNFT